MMKKVLVLNGEIINIGEWESQIPVPENAIEKMCEMEYDKERGWYEVGKPILPTDKERIDMLENIILLMMEG